MSLAVPQNHFSRCVLAFPFLAGHKELTCWTRRLGRNSECNQTTSSSGVPSQFRMCMEYNCLLILLDPTKSIFRKKYLYTTMSTERSESPKSPKFTTAWLGPQFQKVQRDLSFVRKNVTDDQTYTQHKYWKDRNKNTL